MTITGTTREKPSSRGTLAACAWHHAETPGATAVAGGRYLALDVVSARQSDSDIFAGYSFVPR